MNWFQHSTDSYNDPDISEAEDLFGDAGYTVFFKILEIYGREFNSLKGGKLTISKTFVRRKLRKRWGKVEQLLDFFQTKKRFYYTTTETHLTIEIPKFLDIASNWTKRPTKEKKTDLCSPSGVPPAKEVEEEEEKTLNLTADEIENSADKKIIEDIQLACKTLYDQNIFPKVHAFTNTMLKQGKNKRAILHTLMRAYMSKDIKTVWAYCVKIIEVENGNFNEADFKKTAVKS